MPPAGGSGGDLVNVVAAPKRRDVRLVRWPPALSACEEARAGNDSPALRTAVGALGTAAPLLLTALACQ